MNNNATNVKLNEHFLVGMFNKNKFVVYCGGTFELHYCVLNHTEFQLMIEIF